MDELLGYFFDETQHVVKTSTTCYVPVFYEIINLFIELQNFLLMFFICKLKGLYLIIFFLMAFWCLSSISSILASSPRGTMFFRMCLTLIFSRVYSDIKSTSQWDENIMVLDVFPRGVYTMDPLAPQPSGKPEILHLLPITWQSMIWYGLSPGTVLYVPS